MKKQKTKKLKMNVLNRDIKITIVFNNNKKPDLGGLKDTENSKEYYHAFSQTDQVRKNYPILFSRATQKVPVSTQSSTIKREASTQCPRKDLFIDNRLVVEKIPKKYFNSELWKKRREIAALFIQKMIRGCLARKRMEKIKNLKKTIFMEKFNIKKNYLIEKENENQKKIQKRLKPKKKEDFENLYLELKKWKKNEIDRNKQNNLIPDKEKQNIFKMILTKEIELLQTIEKLKMEASHKNKIEYIHNFLKSLGKPKKWLNKNNRYSEVITPLTEIASNLYKLYSRLNKTEFTVEERLDTLLQLKDKIKLEKNELTDEMKFLINREADMINRKRPKESLNGLRTRLSNLFLTYIEDPDNNPEVLNFKKKFEKKIMNVI